MDLDGAPRVGIVGGGQLARMSAAPAAALGVGLRVLATSPQESAAQVIHDVVLGRHDDLQALKQLAGAAAATMAETDLDNFEMATRSSPVGASGISSR